MPVIIWQILIAIVSMYLAEVLAPKPPRPKPSLLEDFDFPTVDDGTPQTVVFGEVWIKDWTVLGIGNYYNEPIILTQKGLFTSTSVTTGYRYGMGLHMGLCRGMDDLVEIKVGDVTAWTGSTIGLTELSIAQPDLFGGDKGEGGIVGLLKIMAGVEDQSPSAELAAMLDDTVPAYRGVVTFLFNGLVCSNSPYPKPWAFRVRRIVTGWDGGVWYPAKAVIAMAGGTIQAMNPVHILYELQTNRDWGRGFSPSQLDLASYQAAADKLFAEGFGLCLAWKRQDQISEFAKIILSHINAAHFIDRTTGLWKLVLIRDDYTIGSLPTFNNSNGLLAIEEDNNSAQDVAMNQVIVTYNDPISNQNRVIQAANIASIQQHGVISQSTTYAGVPIAELAGRIASRDMKMATSGLKRFKVVLDRRAYLIQPASVFVINALEQGIANIVLRAVRVDHDSITNGKITITAMQDIYGLPSTSFISEQPVLWQPPNREALPADLRKVFEVPYFHLLTEFSANTLNETPQIGYVAALASKPSPMHLNYSLLSKMASEAYQERAEGNFCYMGLITEAVGLSATAITVTVYQAPSLYRVRSGSLAMLNDEICRVDSVDVSGSQVTLSRGCIDTVPAIHPAHTVIWFYEDTFAVDQRAYSLDNAVSIKLLPRTSAQQLSISSAPVDIITMQQRMYRPYPPADVKVNTEYYPAIVTGNINLDWLHRNRLVQTVNAPSWTEGNDTAELETRYNLRIYDVNNELLLNESGLNSTHYTWVVPRIFIGDLDTVLDIPMTGADGSSNFTDASANAFVVNNDGVIINTDAAATGGSSAFYDTMDLSTALNTALNLTTSDHCIEGRWKTPSVSEFDAEVSVALVFLKSNGEIAGAAFADGYTAALNYYNGTFTLSISGYQFNTSTGLYEQVSNAFYAAIAEDTYFDWAIEKIEDTVTVYIDGVDVGNIALNFITESTARKLLISAHNSELSFMFNGLRITKRASARYGAEYTPSAYATGGSDPYWSDVELLIPMTGTDGGNSFSDVSTNGLTVTATKAIITKTDALANGGSAARFCKARLSIPYDDQLNLRNKNFIIEGRAKISQLGSDYELFNFFGSMSLYLTQYNLTLKNNDNSQSVQLTLIAGIDGDLQEGAYFSWKVERDTATGIAIVHFNHRAASGLFNPSITSSGDIYIGNFGIVAGNFNGFKVQTVDGTEGTIPNVANPIKIELESKRDGITSFQTYTSQHTVI